MCSTRKRKVLVAIVLQNTLGVLRSFGIFTGKRLCWNLFSSKVTGSRAASLLKKRPQHKSFPVNIAKFSKTAFFYGTPPGAASVRFVTSTSNAAISHLNPIVPNAYFYTPWKHQKILRFFDVFRGYTNVTLRTYRLKYDRALLIKVFSMEHVCLINTFSQK